MLKCVNDPNQGPDEGYSYPYEPVTLLQRHANCLQNQLHTTTCW